MSRYQELSQLRTDFDTKKLSPEVVQKRSAQLLQAFKKDRPTHAQAVILWNEARSAVSQKRKQKTRSS